MSETTDHYGMRGAGAREPRVEDFPAFVRRQSAPVDLDQQKRAHAQLRSVEQTVTETIERDKRDARQEVIDRIAADILWLPLREAMQMADEIVTMPDYKPPTTKVELAILMVAWSERRAEEATSADARQ